MRLNGLLAYPYGIKEVMVPCAPSQPGGTLSPPKKMGYPETGGTRLSGKMIEHEDTHPRVLVFDYSVATPQDRATRIGDLTTCSDFLKKMLGEKQEWCVATGRDTPLAEVPKAGRVL